MRFDRPFALLLTLILAVVPSCDSRDRRITDLCVTLNECTDYLRTEHCSDVMMDSLQDRRITDRDLARCSQCLGDHERDFPVPGGGSTEEDCYDLLVERDCDKACDAVPLALRARTSREMRDEMCDEIGVACGADLVTSCDSSVQAEFQGLELEAQLELDALIADCRQCVVTPGRKPLTGPASDVAACSALLDGCRERCRQVRTVNTLFETAADAVAVCKLDTSCFPSCRAVPPAFGSGGVGGEGGDGGHGGSTDAGGAPSSEAERCLQRLFDWVRSTTAPVSDMSGAGGMALCGAAAGSAGAGTSAMGGAGATADQREATSPSHREELAECALCVGSLPCEAIGSGCANRCEAVASVRGR
jgi:hypothetical protein